MKGELLELIDKYAEDLRKIICQYEDENGTVPTGDDLLWLLCELHGKDLTK